MGAQRLQLVSMCLIFFFNDTATTEIYTYRHTHSLHDALPIWPAAWPDPAEDSATGSTAARSRRRGLRRRSAARRRSGRRRRSEEHTSELQSLMRISYAVFCSKTTNSLVRYDNTLAQLRISTPRKRHAHVHTWKEQHSTS